MTNNQTTPTIISLVLQIIVHRNRDFLKIVFCRQQHFQPNSHFGGNILRVWSVRQPSGSVQRDSGAPPNADSAACSAREALLRLQPFRATPPRPAPDSPPSPLGSVGGGGGLRGPSSPSTAAWRASRAAETSHCSPYTTPRRPPAPSSGSATKHGA